MNKRGDLLAALGAALGCALLLASCAKPDDGGGCPTGQDLCGNVCANEASDSNNCGSCGTVCSGSQQCTAGQCVCRSGLLSCNGSCVASDSSHCGSCTKTCSGAEVCDNGNCSSSCSSGTILCGSGCANTSTDPSNCGGCNTSCHSDQTCSNGSCGCGPGTTLCSNGLCAASCPSTGTGGSRGNPGTGGSPGGGTGGVITTGGTGGVITGGGTGGSPGVGGGGTVPAGYWTYKDWHGCAWTGVDTVTVAPNKTTITPTDFTAQAGTSGPYHVSGSVGQDPPATGHPGYGGVALLGFNLNQPAAGTSCVYNPSAASSIGSPGVTFAAGPTGIAVNFSKTSSTGVVRIQLQGPNGATDATQRWCYGLTQVQGKDFAPFSRFFTQCWNDSGNGTPIAGQSIGAKYNGEPVSAIVFLVPGGITNLPYDFTVNGFALGSSAADAPDGGTVGSLSGTIGGTDAAGSTNADFQRVKITGGTPLHSYIIQNNNWGNPTGTDQTITYKDNSFTITSITGGDLGAGMVRSFPSIYIGANGNTMSGAYSTIGDDNLPKQVSTLTSVKTSFTWSGGNATGNYNATYDVWFNSGAPNLTTYPSAGYAEYKDGVSGFLMVWLYKPSQNNPIGGSPAHSGVAVPNVAGTWNVYIGPRGGGSSAPVVSYVATSKLNSLTFDLRDFINHAVSNSYGIQSAWYLTDVFAGFEIWNGGDASGLKVTSFTADVK